MISKLLSTLDKAGLNLNVEEVADLLWLVPYLGQANVNKGEVSPKDDLAEGAIKSPSTEANPPKSKNQKPTPLPNEPTVPPSFQPSGLPLYGKGDGSDRISTLSGLPFKSPSAPALSQALELGRALRPFRRRVTSRTNFVLNEAATAHRIAEEGIWFPILQPAPRRWLDVALVIDASASMVIWQQTITELRLLIERQGAFRDVRMWSLVTDSSDGQLRLYSGRTLTHNKARVRNPRELVDTSAQRLILIVTDCASRGWYTPAINRLVSMWGRTNPVAIIQMLPQRLWQHTSLSNVLDVDLRATLPGVPNISLEVQPSNPLVEKNSLIGGMPVPVVTLEPESVANWTQALLGLGNVYTSGFMFNINPPTDWQADVVQKTRLPQANSLTAKQRVNNFRAKAAPLTRRLAELLAATPVSLPIIRLIQQTMLVSTGQEHLAELFLSDLLEEVPSTENILNPDYIQYEFVPGVRELLLDTLTITDATQVLVKVSHFINEKAGSSFDFPALLANPTSTANLLISESSRPFAIVAAKVLRKYGGNYSVLAKWLEENNILSVGISNFSIGRRYALCVGISQYTAIKNHDLRFAAKDAEAIAQVLEDPQQGNFEVIRKLTPEETTLAMLRSALIKLLNDPDRKAEDLVVVYISCHGALYPESNNFYLLPSDARFYEDGQPDKETVLDIHDITKTLTDARVKNVVFLLDTCHSGGAGEVLRNLSLNSKSDTSLYIIGAARQYESAIQEGPLKHSIFTHCLLRAFEQKPSRNDGWITVSEVLSFVADAIKEERTVQRIQVHSTAVSPNLRLVQNPQYSPESRDFAERVKSLLHMIGYKLARSRPPENGPAGYSTATIKAGPTRSKVGIIPFYDKVQPLTGERAKIFVEFIKEQVEEGEVDKVLIVTSFEASSEVKKILGQIGKRNFELFTDKQLLYELIDFEPYLQKLVDDYKKPRLQYNQPALADIYIPLNAEFRQYPKEISESQIIANIPASEGNKQPDYKVTWTGGIEEGVKRWLNQPDRPRLAILADYGSGKTTFSEHLAASLATIYLETDEGERAKCRIPLLISLKEFAKNAVDLEGFLIAYLKQYCNVDNPDYTALLKMAEEGLLLFILDGFDEMALRADSDTVRQNMELFEALATLPSNKILLTTRPEYFINITEEREAFRTYPRLYLQPLDEQQIQLYLQKRVPLISVQKGETPREWKYYSDRIEEIHDLSDLVKRPVLLEIIVKTLPKLVKEGYPVNRPNLYNRYLQGELDWQILNKRRAMLIKRDKRLQIMEEVAVELYKTDKTSLPGSFIAKMSESFLSTEQQSEMEAYYREFLACSFLIRNGNDYRFSHQSFMEYLTACRLAKDITNNQWDIFLAKPLSKTIRGFLIELEQGIAQKSAESASINGRQVFFDRGKLVSCLEAGWNHRWLNINIVSLLAAMEDFSFANLRLEDLDLSGADLRGLNLRDAKLPRVNLTGANLTDTNLTGAFLVGANLTRANLSRANLIRVNLSGAYLHGADLSNAVVSDANLREAQLIGANLTRTSLARTDLISAYLRSATLSEADLSGAKLIRAELIKANLTRARLLGADLSGVDLSGADLSGADLTGADLDKTEWGEIDLRDGRAGYANGRTICVNVTLDHVKGLSGSLRKKLKLGGALLPS